MVKKLPNNDKIIFNQCANGANNEIQLAKCLAALFQVRDEFERKSEEGNKSEGDDLLLTSPSENILSRFLRTTVSTFLPLFQNFDFLNLRGDTKDKPNRSILKYFNENKG